MLSPEEIRSSLKSRVHIEDESYLDKYISLLRCAEDSGCERGEHHHILPSKLFPEYTSMCSNPSNIIKLSTYDHYRAHYFLYKMAPSDQRVLVAFMMMNNRKHSLGLEEHQLDSYASEYALLRGRFSRWLSSVHKGRVSVRNRDGENPQKVSVDDPRYISGELVPSQRFFHKNTVIVKDKEGRVSRVAKTDPRYIAGELVHVTTGITVVRDPSTGQRFSVSTSDPRYISGELIHFSKGTTVVVDREGNLRKVSVDDVGIASGELVNPYRGMVPARLKGDLTGKSMLVSKEEYENGDYEGRTKGMVPVHDTIAGITCMVTQEVYRQNRNRYTSLTRGRVTVHDREGHTFMVAVDDPRYISGELVSIMADKVVCHNVKTGETVTTALDDPRYLSGELQHYSKGKLIARCVATGERTWLNKDDPRLSTGEYIQYSTGKKPVRDVTTGEAFLVDLDDPRLTSGEVIPVNNGRCKMVNTRTDQSFWALADDPRCSDPDVKKVNGGNGLTLLRDDVSGEWIYMTLKRSRYVDKSTGILVGTMHNRNPRVLSGEVVREQDYRRNLRR